MDPNIKSGRGGLNESIFSAASDVMAVMRPKNGVKIRKNQAEFGSGRYVNSNTSRMSLHQYSKMAEDN